MAGRIQRVEVNCQQFQNSKPPLRRKASNVIPALSLSGILVLALSSLQSSLLLSLDAMTVVTPYIDVPTCAAPIIPPNLASQPAQPVPRPSRAPSFPPSAPPAPAPRKFSVPTTSSLSTNVSDMLLSSLLPANLPKMQQSVKVAGMGRVRELSSQREALSLPLVSNNFRRFVTKVS